MTKVVCDFCGKEINDGKKWVVILSKFNSNLTNKADSEAEDVCERCSKNIYKCLEMMKECDWKPDFHEVINTGDFINDEKCSLKLEELNEEWDNKSEI